MGVYLETFRDYTHRPAAIARGAADYLKRSGSVRDPSGGAVFGPATGQTFPAVTLSGAVYIAAGAADSFRAGIELVPVYEREIEAAQATLDLLVAMQDVKSVADLDRWAHTQSLGSVLELLEQAGRAWQ